MHVLNDKELCTCFQERTEKNVESEIFQTSFQKTHIYILQLNIKKRKIIPEDTCNEHPNKDNIYRQPHFNQSPCEWFCRYYAHITHYGYNNHRDKILHQQTAQQLVSLPIDFQKLW